ncbi:MAG TPA: 6-phosphofructokinase [Candidatus Onthoplasma faecipullorum]|nr:6-phosphofructokinase [Candidatus Onthoplasma faecipullorum]
MQIKKVVVLTSGGDAPGMNSAIFGIWKECLDKNIELYGAIGGYEGLIDNNFIKIDYSILVGRINRGGSVLKSGRSPRFLKSTYFNRALKNLKDNKFDGLIVLGGDGSLRGAIELRDAGVNVISIPATIDNDLNFTYTLGYDTATNNIVSVIDNITDSLNAFGYGAVIKIMGRNCTDLINNVAKSINTDLVITKPDFDMKNLIKKINFIKKQQTIPPIVLVLEDVADTVALASTLQSECKIQMRPHILGYIQRGGSPSAFDRRYGITAGKLAVETLKDKECVMIGLIGDNLTKKPFEECFKI